MAKIEEKTKIITDDGREEVAQAPLIISASRSTDIPAFYCDWFFHRLKKGYSAWTNPFNGADLYVSYENTRFIVFWSKNPKSLLSHLDELRERNIKCYIQYSLNDYEDEGLEENVPPLSERIETFKTLAKRPGVGSVIWRFDPLMLTDDIDIDKLIKKIQNIGDQLNGYTEKLVFSYADIALYKKVKHNLDACGVPYHEWTTEKMEELAQRLSAMNKERGWNYTLATCAEKIDLKQYGIAHNRCIDGDLIVKIAWEDKELMDYMKVKVLPTPQPSLFEEGEPVLPEGAIPLPNNQYFISTHKKDKGQRPLCGCMVAKDIGQYNTCVHGCKYCYANTNKYMALENYEKHLKNSFSDTITGE